MKGQVVRNIGLEVLLAHPGNANVLSVGVMRKVRRHIERGRGGMSRWW